MRVDKMVSILKGIGMDPENMGVIDMNQILM